MNQMPDVAAEADATPAAHANAAPAAAATTAAAAAVASTAASTSTTVHSLPRRTRIKICGLSSAADIEHAAALGVDAIGLVFHGPSPRAVTFAQAAELARHLPPFITLTGLFVNADAAAVRHATSVAPLALLQFHGDETPALCRELAAAVRLPWLRALRIGAATTRADLVESALLYAGNGILLDALVDGFGGGGKVFDWSLVPAELAHRAVLSGGLTAQNVGAAIRQLAPYAVDVSSGVEVPGAKGVKDHARMTAFVRAVRAADAA